MTILLIEASTSAIKCLVYKEGHIISKLQTPYNKAVGTIEQQDVNAIWSLLLSSVQDILENVDGAIDAIGLSSVWSSLLITDNNNEPILPLSTWADQSSSQWIKTYDNKHPEESVQMYMDSGCHIHTKYPLWRYRGLSEMTELGNHKIASLPEYIFYKLTGEMVVSEMVASATGYYNLLGKDWHYEALEKAGINKGQLSPIVPNNHQQLLDIKIASELGISPVPVFVAGGDGGLNHLYEMQFSDKVISFSIGTSGAIRVAHEKPLVSDSGSLWSHYLGGDLYVSGGTISGAGSMVNWFLDEINHSKDLESLGQMAGECLKEEAPIFLPFILGEQSPGWHSGTFGGFIGNGSLGQRYYAVLEGVLFNIKQCLESINGQIGCDYTIRLSGGITHSPLWLQMAADILERDLLVSDVSHNSMMGTLYMIEQYYEVKKRPVNEYTKIEPGETSLYASRYQTYLKHYNNLVIQRNKVT